MAVNITKARILTLYKSLLRESKKFPSYNFRMYALRKVRDSFRANVTLSNSHEISNKYLEGAKNLEIIKRQVLIGQLYSADKLVIEKLYSAQ